MFISGETVNPGGLEYKTIEVQMKSVYAHEFTKAHGPAGYLNASFFTA